jgi:diguanylate cyclase (GGDEF)-like protein
VSIIDDVAELNARFEALIEDARRNEAILKRFQNFEIALMDCESPPEFIDLLINKGPSGSDWDRTTLILVDPDYGMQRLFERADPGINRNPALIFTENRAPLSRIYQGLYSPVLTPYIPAAHEFLFPPASVTPASVALLPLMRKKEIIGSFNIGSLDINRFHEDAGADFLQHLAAVIAVCIDNKVSREHLKYLGLIDNLTGVNNRRFFDQRLLEEVARVKRSGTPMSCLFVDADNFKCINDTHGHQIGDQVLRYIARIIRDQVRSIDIVARYGGEEFTVILPQSPQGKALEIAERIRRKIAGDPFCHDDVSINLTASIGISTLLPPQCSHPVELIASKFVEQADQALYAAKNSGRNRTVCYSDLSESIN